MAHPRSPRRRSCVPSVESPVVTIALGLPQAPRAVPKLTPGSVTGAKRVLLAAPRGYCAGVDRAVVAVEKALERYGSPVYVRKQIVHNRHVVSRLEQSGAVFVEDVDEVPEGAHVVFSAHGVSPAVVRAAADRGLRAIDATCPLVTKVHREAVRFARDDYEILLIGHRGHEEVEGTSGEAPDRVTLVGSPDEADTVEVRDPERLRWLSAPTAPGGRTMGALPPVDETREPARRLKARSPPLADPPSDDICYATQNRQVAVKKIAAETDLVLVVGSANSSNSVRLVEVALEHGAGASHRVDDVTEIDELWLDGVGTVGVTSGASVPEILVHEVLAWLAERGFGPAEEFVTAEEDLLFSLPKELRRDIKAARAASPPSPS